MRKVFLALTGLTLSATAIGAEWGVGAGIKQNDSTIYLPININESLRLEPFFTYSERDSEGDLWKSSSEDYYIGIGIFGLAPVIEKTNIYYGARISYYQTKDSQQQEATNTSASSKYSSDGHGYQIAPTIGFEYHITNRFSAGAEAYLAYGHGTYRQKTDGVTLNNSSGNSSNSGTNITLRYFFN